MPIPQVNFLLSQILRTIFPPAGDTCLVIIRNDLHDGLAPTLSSLLLQVADRAQAVVKARQAGLE
jgi:hypothetical protein